jgi:hypothetical protein
MYKSEGTREGGAYSHALSMYYQSYLFIKIEHVNYSQQHDVTSYKELSIVLLKNANILILMKVF